MTKRHLFFHIFYTGTRYNTIEEVVEMYKALMIEDYKEVRDFVKEYFNHKEIEVIEAQNGYEGLSFIR